MASPETAQSNEVIPPAEAAAERREPATEPTNFSPNFDVNPSERPSVSPVTPATTAENERLISNLQLSSDSDLLAQLNGGSDDARIQLAGMTSKDRSSEKEPRLKDKTEGGIGGGANTGDGVGGDRGAVTDFTPFTTKDNIAQTTTDRADVTMHPNGKVATVETTGSNGTTRMEFDENGKPTRTTTESASAKEVSEYYKSGALSSREFSTGGVTARDTFNEQGKQLTSEVSTPDSKTRTQFDESGKPVKIETADKNGLTVEQTKPDGTKTTSTTRLDGSTDFRQEDPNGDIHIRNYDASTKTTRTSNLFADGSSNSVTDSPKERFESQTEANGDFKTTITDKDKGTIVVREGGKDRETVETKMRGA